MSKSAFFTIDTELFYETSCLLNKNVKVDKKYYCENELLAILSLLDKYGIKATLFITYEFLTEFPDIIKNAVETGHEIALHAYNHVSPITINKENFFSDTLYFKNLIEKKLNVQVNGFRAPCFGLNDELLQFVKTNFAYDSSCSNVKNAFKCGNIDLTDFSKNSDGVYFDKGFYEFPLSKGKLFNKEISLSGGGYIRLCPFNIIKRKIKNYVKNNGSYVFYVHPFEVYKGKFPVFKELSALERTFINRGRKTYLLKIEKIIKILLSNGYSFYKMNEYINKTKGN